MMSMQVSIGSRSPRSFAISAIRLPSYCLFFSVRARASAMPSQPPCSSAQVAKSLSFFNRARLAGSFSRSANFCRPALADPQREERAPAVEHRRVGILIRRDVEAAGARRFDLRDVLVDGAPQRHAADLEVEEVHGQLGFVGDANREVELLASARSLRCRYATCSCRHSGPPSSPCRALPPDAPVRRSRSASPAPTRLLPSIARPAPSCADAPRPWPDATRIPSPRAAPARRRRARSC